MTETPAADDTWHRARGGDGKFIRSVDTIDRDRQAAQLIAQGWTYAAVAEHLQYSDKGTAWKAVQLVRREAAQFDGTSEMIRQRQLAEIAEQRRLIWDEINNPAVAISRAGKIVRDDNGRPLADAQALAANHALLVRLSEREARIRGTDAPRRSVSITGTASVAELATILETVSHEDLVAAFAEAKRRLQAEADDLERNPAPRAIPGILE